VPQAARSACRAAIFAGPDSVTSARSNSGPGALLLPAWLSKCKARKASNVRSAATKVAMFCSLCGASKFRALSVARKAVERGRHAGLRVPITFVHRRDTQQRVESVCSILPALRGKTSPIAAAIESPTNGIGEFAIRKLSELRNRYLWRSGVHRHPTAARLKLALQGGPGIVETRFRPGCLSVFE
jgi:hypothetical protein